MVLALVLSMFIGIALGMLGGGGSILTVPILVYGLGVEAKPAIATSLLVVAVTSLAALLQHARSGLVDFRIGVLFGGAGMVGAFAGGRVASFVPDTVLLVVFALLMLATAIAMLRGPSAAVVSADAGARAPLGRILAHGLVVGAVTGLVGAGGGFLIVPALVLLGGMPMQRAVATSLLIIAMKSFAGFAGYLGHVSIDWTLAALVGGAAVAGSFVGSRAAALIAQRTLRTLFAWFVMVMALFVVARELPDTITASAAYQSILVERWPWWVGGLAIGAFVLLLLWLDNKLLGVSTGYSELCALPKDPSLQRSWRPRFLLGIVLGGAASALLAGQSPTWAAGAFDELIGASLLVKVPVLVTAGVLIGYGSRLAGGCTSGHGIVGTALGARASWIATALFMVGGFVTTNALIVMAAP